ncbi:MAG: DUF29 domain-containing protein [Geminicoccaceae bacterium]
MSSRAADSLYEEDFFAWTQMQAKELRRFARARPNLSLDLAHIAEEIADLGKSQRDSLRSWARRIIEHLLLFAHSPAEGPRRGWINEIVSLRSEVEARLTPTLHRDLKRQLPVLYAHARRDLTRKLERYGEGEVAARLPERCPYTLEQVLGDFWPDAQSERAPRA